MFNEKYNGGMEMFAPAHFITMAALAALFILMIIFKGRLAASKRADFIFRMCLATFMLVMEVTFHIWQYTSFGFETLMLPLGLCAFTNILTIIALYTDNGKIIKITYFWAITGAILSILFVDMAYMPPHFRFFHYFLIHFCFMLVNVYYVASGKVKLERKDLYRSSLVILAVGIVEFIIGFFDNTDWLFLRTSPVAEISDFFGFPWYTILWALAVFAIFNMWYYLTKLCFYLKGQMTR